jgi:hypothetical protein
MLSPKSNRIRNRTPGVIANNAPGAVKARYDALRTKRIQLAQAAGFESDHKLAGALFSALECGRVGWYMLTDPHPCQGCGSPTEVAELYNAGGWLLLRPVCPKCSATPGA